MINFPTSMRRSLRPLAALLGLISLTNLPAVSAESRPPNIVMVFIDDLGWGDFSCFGNPDAKTPHIDRLAAEIRARDPLGKHTFVHPVLNHLWNGFDDVRLQLAAANLDPGHFRVWHSTSLVQLLARSALKLILRLTRGPDHEVAVVPMGWITNWMLGRQLIVITGSGFLHVRVEPWRALLRTLRFGVRGAAASLRVAYGKRRLNPIPRVDETSSHG
jgi:hypothetical protein